MNVNHCSESGHDQARDRLPPGPAECFDIGSTDDSLPRMQRYFAEFGDLYRVYAPGRRNETWVVSDPETVKHVLVSNHRNYTKGVGLDRVRILLGNGIMVSEGEFWRRQRRMIQPAFHRRVIERFGELIVACTRKRLDSWDESARQSRPVNITTEMSELTLEIVLRAIFSSDLDRMSDQAGDNPFAVVTREPARNLQFAFRFRSLTRHVIEAVERRLTADEQQFDFLGMLLAARDINRGEPMMQRELVDEVMTLVVAGHETTASALNWIWYLLARNPEAEARLHAELDGVDESCIGLKSMESLRYTRQVINETLRLYPPGWLITRRNIDPDCLLGYEVPAGTDIFLSPYFIHRHPAHWGDDVEAFRPERFEPEAEQARHRYSYIPFVAGPRHCIGETFALYEMALHLALAARRYRLRPHPAGSEHQPVELEAQINLRTRHDLYMSIERR